MTDKDGAAIVPDWASRWAILERRAHRLGDVLRMPDEAAILCAYYRNNVMHLFAMPSLVACAFLNNAAMRPEDVHRLAWRVYPYVREELSLRWDEDEVPGIVDDALAALAGAGLLEQSEDGRVWRRPATGTAEAVQLSVLAQATIQTIERYYLAIALLLRAGRGELTADGLEKRCATMAAAHDHALRAGFAGILRPHHVPRLHRPAASGAT